MVDAHPFLASFCVNFSKKSYKTNIIRGKSQNILLLDYFFQTEIWKISSQ